VSMTATRVLFSRRRLSRGWALIRSRPAAAKSRSCLSIR
jgi:hypothetical protein